MRDREHCPGGRKRSKWLEGHSRALRTEHIVQTMCWTAASLSRTGIFDLTELARQTEQMHAFFAAL